MPLDKKTSTYHILNATGPFVDNILKAQAKSVGFRLQVFYPQHEDSLYGIYDRKYVYKKKPDKDEYYVCLSPIQETWSGTEDGKEYDPFMPDPPVVLTSFKNKLPLNSKVILYYNDGTRYFRVNSHRSIDGANPYVIRNFLQPIS